MLSNKLTFSLVFVLVLVFAATSVYAQVVPEDSEPAKGKFAVVARTAGGTDTNPFGDANGIGVLDPVVPATTELGDLDGILLQGGSIELALNTGDAATFTVRTGTNATSDADIAALKLKHKVVISEIMWGLNLSAANEENRGDAQWIEIYNHGLDLGEGDTLTLIYSLTKQSSADVGKKVPRTVGNTEGMYVILDQVSTSGRFGDWAPKGNSGNTERREGAAGVTDPNAIPPTALVSMYRNIALKDAGYKTVEKGADEGNLEDLGDGNEAASWTASAGSVGIRGYFVGSPGSVHVTDRGTVVSFVKTPATISATGIIINEVRNDTSAANLDWIELYHLNDAVDATAQTIDKWGISIITATKNDDGTYKDPVETPLAKLPKFKLQPDTHLVIYNRDPGDTMLAGGVNIQDVIDDAQVNKGASHMYFVSGDLDLPSDKKFLILLRSDSAKTNHEAVKDYIGSGFFSKVEANKFDTDVFPFIAWTAPTAQGGDNTFASLNQTWGRQTNLNADGVYRPDSRADDRGHGDDWQAFDPMGGVGYDRDVDLNSAPGTPGYANVISNVIANDQDNAKDTSPYAFNGMISISEIMYDARHPRDLVQWIELYNNSPDSAIDIGGWRMEIRNIADGKVESYVDSGFVFDADTPILPNQTLLLVSRTGPSSVSRDRVYDLNQRHREELGLQRRDKVLLSSEGFFIELKAKISEGGSDEMMTVDTAGNLMVDGATRTKQWDLTAADESGARVSIVRQADAGVADPGDMEDSWKAAKFAGLAYYGHRDDVGTPGYRRGGPLPVSLSSFRPVRDKATGEVVIRWITQSELNNAGFNILRTDSKDGEFKVINLQGIIAGHGTTSEKHVYTYTDKTAKPNVVYYYQIEDVSLNGKRTTLATTHMRGNVNVAGKVTTTWGDLKLQK